MMNFASVESFVENVKSGTLNITMLAVTTPKMSRTRRADKRVNPFFGRVEKVTLITDARIGYRYENNVNLELKRKGIDDEIIPEKPNGKHWIGFPKLLAADKDENIHYVRLTTKKDINMKIVSHIFLDGKLCTDKVILAELEEWLPKHYESKKQADLGLDEEEQIKPFDYTTTNVVMIKQGERKYQNDNFRYKVAELLEIFK